MNSENLCQNINYFISKKIIENTGNNRSNPFFDRDEESMLSMLIFYVIEIENKENEISLKNVIVRVDEVLKQLKNIEDFHNLFINVSNKCLIDKYKKSSFYAIYMDYIERSVGMDKTLAISENGWVLNGINSTLSGLKYRFKTNNENIKKLTKTMEAQKILIIDPESEYEEIAKQLEKESSTRDVFMNPFYEHSSGKTRDFINPLAIYPEEITNAQIIKQLNNIVRFKRIQNEDYLIQKILEELCLKNNLNLSDIDKKYILDNFEN